MKKGKLLGVGMTAEVYEWGPDKVVKLYHKRLPDEWASYEARVGKAVNGAGVPSPKTFEIIELNGRKGVVFERIPGRSIMEHIITEPFMLFYYTKNVARLQYEIHKCFSSKLPSQRERFANMLGRSESILGGRIQTILDYMNELPDGNNVCHGDLHFNNIILSDSKYVAIDWNCAYHGCPLGDVARTYLIITSPSAPPGVPDFPNKMSMLVKQQICNAYLNEYMRLANISFKDIDKWILLVAAAKLKDKVYGEEKWLRDIINKRLKLYEKSKQFGGNQYEF